MNVNATIILQAINFWIAYLIFRFILLKPAYAVIVADAKKREELEKLVQDDEKRLAQQRDEIAQRWQASYLFFREHIPAERTGIKIHILERPEFVPRSLDSKESLKKRQALADAIVSAIGVGHDPR